VTIPPVEARLHAVPWAQLAGLAPSLDGPLSEILEGAPAERVLDRFLRARRELDADGRRAVAEALFGVGLWRRRLRWHAGQSASPRLLLASLLRDLAGRDDAERLVDLAAGSLPPTRPAPEPLADRWSLPDWLATALVAAAGPAEAPALAEALCLPAPVALRANAAWGTREALDEQLRAQGIETRAGTLAPHALLVESQRPNLFGSAAWREGLFEVQDEGSQLLAAAVGALAADVGPAGRVHAADPDGDRLRRLRDRASRAGVANVSVHGAAPPAGLRVHRALVDAPCSELGTLRRGPDLRWRLDPASFRDLPALQLALCAGAAAHVLPGGTLVYATCTFRRPEDEEVALAFEARHLEFQRLRPEAPADCVTPEGFLRTWPHRQGCDAFFAAAWTRRRCASPPRHRPVDRDDDDRADEGDHDLREEPMGAEAEDAEEEAPRHRADDPERDVDEGPLLPGAHVVAGEPARDEADDEQLK
jgi:16S rRNA (cytosine967-C5)-methyltransferase